MHGCVQGGQGFGSTDDRGKLLAPFCNRMLKFTSFVVFETEAWFDALLDLSGCIRFIHQWTKKESKFCSFNIFQQSRA